MVEHSGEHRGGLNLKRGGLLPISALARWLAIATGDVRGSTPDRLTRAAAAGLLTADGGASRVVLIPAIPDPLAALDSLARLVE